MTFWQCPGDADQARLKAANSPHAGDWLNALPIASVRLRLSDEEIRVAAGYHLGFFICQPHQCVCGSFIDARGLHGLSCRKSAPRHVRHSLINDILRRAIKKAQVLACKEPVALSRSDGKRPDGATLIPWSHGKPLARDVTVPDTFVQSHITSTATNASAAADRAACSKKHEHLNITHNFIPFALESGGSWNSEAIELINKIGNRITAINSEPLVTIHDSTDFNRSPERQCPGVPEHIPKWQ